jgi:nitrogen regulatory protein P-II 1
VKKLEAVIRPHALDDVKQALAEMGVQGLTAYEVRGFGRQKGQQAVYLGGDVHNVDFLPKVKIEIVVADSLAEAVETTILEAARSGKIGDGKVFVYDCENAVRIRTGERGTDAL